MTSNKPVFRPSSAHRWSNCPGSATLEAQVPGKPASSYALEGTAAHELCRYFAMLSAKESDISRHIGNKVGSLISTDVFDPEDFEYPEEIGKIRDLLIDPTMASSAWTYCEYVYEMLGNINPLNRDFVRFEEKVKTSFGIEGTADCLTSDWPYALNVIDFKYGVGVSVDPFKNLQLLIYALGALDTFDDESDFEKIILTIIQPRDKLGNVFKQWELSKNELETTWFRKIKKAHTTALAKPNSFKIGAWCRWCNGAETCPKATRTTTGIVKAAAVAKVPKEIKKLQKVLEAEQLVLEFLNQCKMEAFNRLQRGEVIPGYKLVQSFGNSKWIDEEKARSKANFDIDEIFIHNRKLKSPSQMKKVFKEMGKSSKADWIDKHVTRPLKGLVLVPESDKRSAYASAQQDFEDE